MMLVHQTFKNVVPICVASSKIQSGAKFFPFNFQKWDFKSDNIFFYFAWIPSVGVGYYKIVNMAGDQLYITSAYF
jgi:hypothetical protein